jgi:DNA replication initiation complex subunit (GINS family)
MLKALDEILQREKETRELTSVSTDFFFQLQEHITALKLLKDPVSQKKLQLIQDGIHELVNVRAEKILKGHTQNMLQAESRLAECVLTFQKFKRDVLESLLQKDIETQKVTILTDIPQFYGPQMEVLGPYKKGDVVLLDKTIATLLKEKGLIQMNR